MPLPNPPFPRRGIPSPKAPRLPGRREEQKPFFRTRQGFRLLFYGFLLLAFGGAMLGKLGQWKARQDGPASRSAAPSRPAVPLTSPPKAFVSSDVRHSLMTLEDFAPSPRASAIALVLRSFKYSSAESRSAPPELVDLEIDESIAHPEAFRGGFVRTRGGLIGIETRGPEEALTYRGWLIVGGRNPQMVVWETDEIPKFELNESLDVEGAFLQPVTFEDAAGKMRTSPFIVAASVKRTAPAEQPSSFRDKLFTPAAIFLIILILATTLFLVKKSRRSASPNRYVARPPGPGR